MTNGKATRSLNALNWLNFFAADVATGVGPFLAIYLMANQHWNPAKIGIAMAAMSIATVVTQPFAGLLVDKTIYKRYLVVMVSLLIGAAGFSIFLFPCFGVVIGAQIVMGASSAFFLPVLVALVLGIAGAKLFDKTISRNQTYNHAGNVVSAISIGVIGKFTHNNGIFYGLLIIAVASAITALAIREKDIDHDRARSEGDKNRNDILRIRDILSNKIFVLFLLISFLFHFANAAMLPLVGQELSKTEQDNGSLYMAGCIIIAQLVMTPVSYYFGNLAADGRKRILLIAFIALPIRGILYTLSTNPIYLLSVQVLDGIGAGIFGVVSIMIISDLMANSGRSNFAQGILAATVGLGATLSNLGAGFLVNALGYNAGFLALAGLAVIALLILWFAMPETVIKTGKPDLGSIN